MKIKKIVLEPIKRPLKVLFSTSLGNKKEINSVIVKIILENNTSAIGECPTSFVSRSEDIKAIKQILHSAKNILKNKPIEDYEKEVSSLRKEFSGFPLTISGLEVALFRAYLTAYGMDEYTYWGANLSCIETDITIPFLLDLKPLKTWLNYAIEKGFKIFKIKVSGKIEEDSCLLSIAHEILKDSLDEFIIRLDGNQGFTEKTYLKFQDIIEKKGFKIQCFEQPLEKDDFSGMKNVKKHSHIPIILDETVFNTHDLYRVISENICDGVNIKVAKSGVIESKKMIDIAKKHNLKLMIGCMTETMIGLSAGIYLACGTGNFDFIDLDSIFYLTHRNHYGNITITPPAFLIKKL